MILCLLSNCLSLESNQFSRDSLHTCYSSKAVHVYLYSIHSQIYTSSGAFVLGQHKQYSIFHFWKCHYNKEQRNMFKGGEDIPMGASMSGALITPQPTTPLADPPAPFPVFRLSSANPLPFDCSCSDTVCASVCFKRQDTSPSAIIPVSASFASRTDCLPFLLLRSRLHQRANH